MSNKTYNNPWAGLSSYQDPETSDIQLKFCGRGNESFDVAQLIDDNIFVTLYGKSGTGKTSLLNAGVFPRLRENQYLPVSIRLGMDAMGISFQQCILTKLNTTLQGKGKRTTIEVVPMSAEEQSTEYLWSFFARTKFCNNEGEVLFPVLVFDQFEEVFRDRHQDAEVLLRQIHFMMDENHALTGRTIDGELYQYDFNFRFVVSIREDDLYRLEDSIDNCYLSDMKRCRYRLRSLTEEGARDAILIPGEGLFRHDEQESIVNTIVNIARNKEDQSISTNLLSLVCSRIFVEYEKAGVGHITPTLVDTFIKGNPFERFYNEATHGFSHREKGYIEDHLVDSTGRRNSIPESDFLLHVPKGKLLLEGNSRILQRTSTSSDGGNYRIELIHDSFCKPLIGQKAKREKRRNLMQILLLVFSSFAILTISYLIIYNMSLKQDKMLVNQSRFIAEKAISEIDNYDSYMARLLALNVLPKNLSDADRPYVAEAEIALRKASMLNNGIMRGHRAAVNAVYFSPNGKSIISVARDTTVRIWDTKTGLCLQTLQGHSDALTSTSISSDGNHIITGSDDNTIRIWDTNTGQCRYILKGHTGGITGAFFSNKGTKVISCSKDKTIRFWDLKTKRCLLVLRGHHDWVNNIALSPDKKMLMSVSEDNTIRIWDTTNGKCLHILERNEETVYDALFSPDGQNIISSWDEKICLWNISAKTWFKPMTGHTDPVSKIAFTPNKKYMVSSSWDNTIRIWDYQTGKCLQVLKGHTDKANNLSFSADGKKLVSSSYDKTIRIWDIATGTCTQVLSGHTDKIRSTDISPDGKFIVSASSDKSVRLWDISTIGKTLQGHISAVGSAIFSPDGKKVITAYANVICIWDVASGKCLHVLKGHSKDITSLRFTKDGEHFLSSSFDGTIRLWQMATGKCMKVFQGHSETIKAIEISPDGKKLVYFSENNLFVWDVQTGKEQYTLKGHEDRINHVAFDKSGNQIISASNDSTIRLWDLSKGSCLRTIKGHGDWVTFTCFTPKQQNILSLSMDDTLRIWNPVNGQLIHKCFSYYIHQAVISPNGKHIITALRDKSLCLRDAETGECLSLMAGHKEKISTMAFSPDNTKIVSASKDMTVRIWDVTTGTCLQVFDGYTSPLVSVGFSPNNHQIVSASYDGTIRILDFPPLQELIDQTRERFKNRQLTPEERRKYYLE